MTFSTFEKTYRQVISTGTIFGLGLMIISLAHSKYTMSIAQFILAGAFVLDRIDLRKVSLFFRGNHKFIFFIKIIPYHIYLLFDSIYKGLKLFLKNKAALIFISILLMHVAGLIFTTDFNYAMKDLRTKLPIFLLPLFISTSQSFGRKGFYWFILLFCTSVFVRTLINTWGFVHENFVDIRDISKAISHLIIALMIAFSIFSLGWLISRKRTFPLWMKILFSLMAVWMIIYMVITQSATGLLVTFFTFVIFLIVIIIRSNKIWLRIVSSAFIFLSFAGIAFYFGSVVKDYYKVNPVDLTKLEKVTARGNQYVHNTKDLATENGNYLWIYIQWDELRESWAKRSRMSLTGVDKKNQLLLNTLIRFLASKGDRKDTDGVNHLSDKEVRAIENGVANVIFIRDFGISGRIYEFLSGYDEYRKTGNPSGSTVMQRLEFWKASVGIIRDHWLTGVGTGDMNEAFQQQYIKMNSQLPHDQRWRSHNQFLSIFVGFGIFGLIWFLFCIFYPPYFSGKYHDFFFLIFLIIALLSMVTEDTIESQAGVTFFAFFYSFLMWGRKEEDAL